MTELAIREDHTYAPTLLDQMDYARTVATATMLPDSFRGKPADIMLAMGLGQSMGLSPAESLYRINVIKGKPCASAELIAANVRKAGHRLRIVTDETGKSVVATIFRADDPDFAFEVRRDEAWARSMGLAGQGNYSKQLLTMLQWRAITACARLACPEALYGVAYTADELADDSPRATVTATATTGADRMRAVLNPTDHQGDAAAARPEAIGAQAPTTDGGSVERGAGQTPLAAPPTESPLLNTRGGLAKRMFASLNDAGVTDADRLTFCSAVIGRVIKSSKEMTDADAEAVIAACADDYRPAPTREPAPTEDVNLPEPDISVNDDTARGA